VIKSCRCQPEGTISSWIRSRGSSHRLALLVLACFVLFISSPAFAICIPTVYNVISGAPPPIGNWTDASGAVWTPSGGFPGCAPGDTASDTNATPTTLIINSAIPNPIIGLSISCTGCAIDVQSGGSLTLAGPGSFSASSTIIVEPSGLLTMANSGSLTFNAGTSLSVNGGMTDVDNGGSLILNGASTVTNGGSLNIAGAALMSVNNLFTVQSSGTLNINGGTVDGSNTVHNLGLIDGYGTLSANVANDALMTIGDAPATLQGSTLTWNGGSAFNFQLGNTNSTADTDLLALSGTLTKGTAGTYMFHFSDGNGAPQAGVTYTLITFGSTSGFAATDFTFDYVGANPGLNGTFSITASALTFTPSALPVRLQSFDVN